MDQAQEKGNTLGRPQMAPPHLKRPKLLFCAKAQRPGKREIHLYAPSALVRLLPKGFSSFSCPLQGLEAPATKWPRWPLRRCSGERGVG
jgi:hypothetical protein